MSNIIPFPYQGQLVRFNSDGWINATDVAKRFGKRPNDWLSLPSTADYIDALKRHLFSDTGKSGNDQLIVSRRGGRDQGTWLHPKLAVAFARWLDVDFAVWCDLQIDALLHGEIPARQRFDMACKALEDQNERGSMAGRELANHRWRKPGLEHEVDHWRNQVQMTLGLDAA